MTDHNLTDHAADEAAKTEMMINQCSEFLFSRFDWESRTAEVEEALSIDHKMLTAAHKRFMQGYCLDLQLLFNKAAMKICERSAVKLVKAYKDKWLEELEQSSHD